MSFITTDDNKNVYQYMISNDCPGLATYYIDKPWKFNYEQEPVGMQNRTPCEIPCEAGYYAVNYVKTEVQHI